jgi:hypothetical protein
MDVVHFRQPGSGVQCRTGKEPASPFTCPPCSATTLAAGATDFILPIILIMKELTDCDSPGYRLCSARQQSGIQAVQGRQQVVEEEGGGGPTRPSRFRFRPRS